MDFPPVHLSRGLRIGAPCLAVLFALGDGRDPGAFVWAGLFVALMVASAGLHEMGHVAAVRGCGLTVESVTLTLFGGVTHFSGHPPTRAGRAAIAAAGPLASAFLAAALLAAWVAVGGESEPTPQAGLFGAGSVMNASIAAFNLLPVPGFDGARILAALLGRERSRSAAARSPRQAQTRSGVEPPYR